AAQISATKNKPTRRQPRRFGYVRAEWPSEPRATSAGDPASVEQGIEEPPRVLAKRPGTRIAGERVGCFHAHQSASIGRRSSRRTVSPSHDALEQKSTHLAGHQVASIRPDV